MSFHLCELTSTGQINLTHTHTHSTCESISSIRQVRLNSYHNAFGEIVEDGGFESEDLPSDDGVGQSEADKEWLEDSQPSVGRHAEAHRGDTKSSGCPLSDGVRHYLLHIH